MGDPIKKQAAIVRAITQGQVEWTVEHREALKAAMEKRLDDNFSPSIWADVLKLVACLAKTLPDYKKKIQ